MGISFAFPDDAIDCTTAAGRNQLDVVVALGAFERQRIAVQIKAGLERARRKGKQVGRPRKVVPASVLEPLRDLSYAKWPGGSTCRRRPRIAGGNGARRRSEQLVITAVIGPRRIPIDDFARGVAHLRSVEPALAPIRVTVSGFNQGESRSVTWEVSRVIVDVILAGGSVVVEMFRREATQRTAALFIRSISSRSRPRFSERSANWCHFSAFC